MPIRPEQQSDFPAIYDLVKTAFETAKVSNGDEQNYVNRLRASPTYIPELALVATDEGGALIGHIMLSTLPIIAPNGTDRHTALLLAPLAVALPHRSKGIASLLMKEAFSRALAMSHRAVLLVGDPAYYTRHGFQPSTTLGITNTDGIPDMYVMACELVPGGLAGICGSVTFPR